MVASSNGSDTPACGTPAQPCATLAYAVNHIASALAPLSARVTVLLGPGRYPGTSCGAVGARPLNITGGGSATTLVDCGGAPGRLLVTNDSLVLAGLTVVGAAYTFHLDVSRGTPDGGGAVAVLWAATLHGAYATVQDVVFAGNSVFGVTTGNSTWGPSSLVVGGGALLIAGGASGQAVRLRSVVFHANTLVVQVDSAGEGLEVCGGGAAVALGGPWNRAPVANVSLVVEDAVVSGNSASCANSSLGAWLTGTAPRGLRLAALCLSSPLRYRTACTTQLGAPFAPRPGYLCMTRQGSRTPGACVRKWGWPSLEPVRRARPDRLYDHYHQRYL
jgi:hypothetical protein